MNDKIVKKKEELQEEALKLVQNRDTLIKQLERINNRLAEIAGAIKTLDELS